MNFSPAVLDIDAEYVIGTITATMREQVRTILRKRGFVLGLSGGVDSAVCAALCARAAGTDSVLALLMPERDASGESVRLGQMVGERLGVRYTLEDIGPILEAAGCYRRQDDAIRTVVTEYGEGWKCKVVLPSKLEQEKLNVPSVVVQSPRGDQRTIRLSSEAYLHLIAATNFKQRTRAMLEYYHADRLNYAVCGTSNRPEYDQGFFVKNGDGSADVKPLAHLYKTQVYLLADALGIPKEVTSRTPTTDTFSLPQTQEEFFFSIPYGQLDLCLYAHDHDVPKEAVAEVTGLSAEQVARVYRDIESKRRATRSLHLPSLVVEEIGYVHHSDTVKTGGR